jgi:hypothetical protein
MASTVASLLSTLALASSLSGTGSVVDAKVEGDTLVAEIAAGGASATLALRFEQVVGLSLDNVGLSVEAINPLDTALLARLGPSASLLPAFPVLVRIEPPADGGLAFSGVVELEIYTHDLHFAPGALFRMYAASAGGSFLDITSSEGSGSYRSGGVRGNFSEFLLASDIRATSDVVNSKYQRLSGLLSHHAAKIQPLVQAELGQLHTASLEAWQQDDVPGAITQIEAFARAVKEHSGTGLPDVWRSTGDLDNVAGELRAAAATLRFSLTLASNAL